MKIFVVEDDEFYGKVLAHHLSLNPDYHVERFTTGEAVLNKLVENPDVITLDYSLPKMTGLEVLEKIKAYNNRIPVIIISGQEDIKTAVQLLQEGAYDYIVKDDNTKDRLWNVMRNVQERAKLEDEVVQLKKEISSKYAYSNTIKGKSQPIIRVFELIEKASKTNITVSVTGETGTGKELVAKAIHYNSPRKDKAFVTVNIAAIPDTLIESELFGHEKGAFTDAVNRRIGKFEEADGGTIFLDEIGEMDIQMQAKLLRVLQEKEVTRLGGTGAKKINVRVITATHRDLKQLVEKGDFREDLYYRLLGLPIRLAPLRERGNDVLILAKYFLEEFVKENDLEEISISNEAQNKLMSYSFPGNVRELKAVMELAAVMCSNNTIEPDNINFTSASQSNNIFSEEKSLRAYQVQIITHFLERYNRDIELVADKLEIGKSTIYRMMQNKEIVLED